jgi:hypothetical protein
MYSWLVPLLGAISLISFIVWYALIGHKSFFGFFSTPDKPSFGNDVIYGGLALMYLIPVFLFASWFGDGIINAIKQIFKKKKEYTKPSNFELLETWQKAIIFIAIAVGLYAVPALAFVYLFASIFFVGGAGSDSSSGSGADYSSYADPKASTVNNPSAELQEAYQYTSGILREVKYRKINFYDYQKRDLLELSKMITPNLNELEEKIVAEQIKRIAYDMGIEKDKYSNDRGEIYILPLKESEENNKREYLRGIKKDIERIVKRAKSG